MLNQQEVNNLEIGDVIEICTFHYRSGRIHESRIIRDIYTNYDGDKTIYVKCFGWANFKLRKNEIISLVTKKNIN
nr:hypothetical protein [uncultured Mediterranean phage uvMED]